MKRRAVAALVLVGALAVAGCSTPESSFPTKVNDARKAAGKGPLSTEPPGGLDTYNKARLRSAANCQARSNDHSLLSAYNQPGLTWDKVGENVGSTAWNQKDQNTWPASTDALWNAFWNSPGHRANILGTWDYQVVAQWVCDNGRLYVTHVFLKR